MSYDYNQAARRHLADARGLLGFERQENADQLFGLAAECALKALLVGLGLRDPQEPNSVPRSHRIHLPGLWGEFHAYGAGRLGAQLMARLPAQNPFANWSVNQRYWRDGELSQADVQAHGAAAASTLELLQEARNLGVIR